MPSVPKVFGSQINLKQIPVLGIVAENAAAPGPASPVDGQYWYDTTNKRMNVRENGAWVVSSNTGVELLSNKGVANGYAPLNASVQVPLANLPIAASGVNNSTQIVRADDTRLADNRIPVDASVTGGATATGVKIAQNTITEANVNPLNKDGAPTTPSMRTLGTTAQTAMAGNTTLNAIPAPVADVSFNSRKGINLADPTAASDVANKNYVDTQLGALSSGLDVKASVRAASTANVAVTYTAAAGTSGRGQITVAPNALDGVTLAAGNRILLKDQTTAAQNGIWVVTTLGTGANGVWDRATDFDQDSEVTAGAFTFVEEGTINDNSGFVLTTNNPIIIGGASGTSLAWAQFSGAGSIVAGNGLTKAGSTLSAVGTANRIIVTASGIDIDPVNYVGQTSITTLGNITAGTWNGTTIAVNKGGTGAITAAAARSNLGANGISVNTLAALVPGTETTYAHGLANQYVQAKFFDATTGYEIDFSWRTIDANTIGVTADTAFALNAVRVVVQG